jgi:hypothetical protein
MSRFAVMTLLLILLGAAGCSSAGSSDPPLGGCQAASCHEARDHSSSGQGNGGGMGHAGGMM